MEWREYIKQTLLDSSDFDNLLVSLDSGVSKAPVPPIVKASLIMLEKMIKNQGKRNFFIFPELEESFLIFVIFKVFYNILLGKIKGDYNPKRFKKGEILKLGNAIVQFNGITQVSGTDCISVVLAEGTISNAPMDLCPAFQKVETKRKLSKYAVFKKEKERIVTELAAESEKNKYLSRIIESKTHMDGSIGVVTSVARICKQISGTEINSNKLSDVFLFASANYEGEIKNIASGQLAGNPAMIFTSDLYSVCAVMEQPKCRIQSLIVDVSNSNGIQNQLDALDDLLKKDIPVVCFTDNANAYELDSFKKRNFNIWQWNSNNITDELCSPIPFLISEKKLRNIKKHCVEYLGGDDDDDISIAMNELSRNKKGIQNASTSMMRVFDILSNLVFNVIRRITPFTETDVSYAVQTLNECIDILNTEKKFISEENYNGYIKVVKILDEMYNSEYKLPKIDLLRNRLTQISAETVFLVVSNKCDKNLTEKFWNEWNNNNAVRILVVYPDEYFNTQEIADRTIIIGWFKYSTMRKLIYSGVTAQYDVLLYKCERSWQGSEAYYLQKINSCLSNKDIVRKSLSTKGERIDDDDLLVPLNIPIAPQNDELAEIENIVHDNRIKRYVKNVTTSQQLIDVVPVSFVGNYISFYRLEHKIISVSRIVFGEETDAGIDLKTPAELFEGEFIAVRETNRDLIKEIADNILSIQGQSSARSDARLWKDALRIEMALGNHADLLKKLKKNGCNKGNITIQKWLDDENMIAPKSREDVEAIALATENETLFEKIDQVCIAASDIRAAHIKAGRILSDELKRKLADKLRNNSFDPFNIWEPIDLYIENVGNIKIMKVIDVGSNIQVDSADVNRLIRD